MPRRPASALLGLLLLALPAAAAPPAPSGHSILVVDAEDPWRPGYVSFMTAFQAALRDATAAPVAIYAENLDLARFESPAYRRALRSWYEAKYGDRRLDAVVAVGTAVLGPLQAWRTELWPDVPLVFVADARTLARIGQPAGTTGVTFELDPVGSARAALALRPDTRRIALVGGADPYTRGFAAEVRQAFGDRLEWIDLTGLRMPELRQRVATLPERTIILYTTLYRDGGGQAWIRAMRWPPSLAMPIGPPSASSGPILATASWVARCFTSRSSGRRQPASSCRCSRGSRPHRSLFVTSR